MAHRTDLATELAAQAAPSLPGLTRKLESFGALRIETVSVTTPQAAKAVGKPAGDYVTVTTPPFHAAQEVTEEETAAIARHIAAMLPESGLILIVGLGNNDITPDAVGPRTVRRVLATRHIGGEAKRQAGLEDLRPVAALAPGVLGQTGIETSEIVGAVVKDIRPAAVVVIDALAARDAGRLGRTVQIANTGIAPGSGVHNSRKELSGTTLGVPVVSIGVPTVIDAATLAADLLPGGEDRDDVRARFAPEGVAMMITPREIDSLLARACRVLSQAVNKALQPSLTLEELDYLSN